MTAIRNHTKKLICDIGEFMTLFWNDFCNGFRSIQIGDFVSGVISELVICIAYAFFCNLREGTGTLYMSVFIPVFFANMLIVLFGCVYKSSGVYTLLTVFLVTTGVALQIFMLPPEGSETLDLVYQYVTYVFAGILISFICLPFLAFMSSQTIDIRFVRGIVLAATLILYGLLLVFGKQVNGVKAWIYIGGMSFQVTEVTKMLAGMYVALCMIDSTLTEKKKTIKTLSGLFVHIGCLALAGEIGTLLVICVVYFILKLLYTENKKYLICEVICLILVFAIALGIFYGLSKLPEPDVSQVQTEEEAVSNNSSVLVRLKKVYPRIEERFNIFLNRGDIDEDDTRQIRNAEKALLNVEWFGSERGSYANISEIESDFIFIYLIVRLGIVGMVMVLISLFTMFTEVYIAAARTSRAMESVFAICFISFIVLGSLISICSNIEILPIVGIPFAFLANGGSAMCVNLIMSFFIVYFMRNKSANSKIKGNGNDKKS